MPKRAMSVAIFVVSWTVLALAILAAVVPSTSPLFVIEAAALYLFAASVVVTGTAAVRRSWAALPAGVASGLVLAVILGPLWSSAPRPGDSATLTLVWHNVENRDQAALATLAWARRHGADGVILAETPLPRGAWWSAQAQGGFPCVAMEGKARFVLVATRAPCGEGAVRKPADTRFGWLDVHGGLPVTVVAYHAIRPYRARGSVWPTFRQDAHPRVMRTMGSAYEGARRTLVVGDFNAVPWSTHQDPLLGAGLKRVPCALGVLPTWGMGPAALPIDQVFVSPDLAARCKRGPRHGSDHHLLLVEIELGTEDALQINDLRSSSPGPNLARRRASP